MAAAAAAAPPTAPPVAAAAGAAFALGSAVVVQGLQAKPEHNGQAASVLGWDEAKGRYRVSLSGSGVVLALKPSNLTAAAPGGGMGGGITHDFGSFAGAAPAPAPAPAPQASSASAASLAADDFGSYCGAAAAPAAAAPTSADEPHAVFGVDTPPAGMAEAGLSPAALLKPHLLQLKELFNEGLITQEEFDKEKAALLRSVRPSC